MKHTSVQMMFLIDEKKEATAEVRTWNGKWVGDARISPTVVGEHDSSEDARRALVKKLRELADVVERDGGS